MSKAEVRKHYQKKLRELEREAALKFESDPEVKYVRAMISALNIVLSGRIIISRETPSANEAYAKMEKLWDALDSLANKYNVFLGVKGGKVIGIKGTDGSWIVSWQDLENADKSGE